MKIEKIIIEGIKSHKKTVFYVENYITLVGENNTGKSNILFAIRWFCNDVKLKREDLTHTFTENPSVQMKFKLEAQDNIPDSIDGIYIDAGSFWIKAYCKSSDLKEKSQAPKYQLIKEGKDPKDIKKLDFFEIIFVPSIRELSDELKFTANSTINKLISKFVIERIKNEDGKAQKYSRVNDSIKELSDYINEGEESAFEKLRYVLKKNMLDYRDVDVSFKLEPPNVEDLIKNYFRPLIKTPTGELPIDSQGMGFQRSLIFSLICSVNELEKSSESLTVYLIEEPELFLHPNHQVSFRTNLMSISNKLNNQVILTSHSPYFINNIEDYSQIKRISLRNNHSELNEINQVEIKQICIDNGKLLADAKNETQNSKWNTTKLNEVANKIAEEDELRYLLWVDPERANSFLSKKVILVEGKTEKAFFSFQLNNSNGSFHNQKGISDICIIDVNGKYHFYKFANLLKKLGIPCWIIYDGDDDQNSNGISHRKLNEYIEKMKSDGIIIDCLRLDPELENCLGFQKENNNADISMYHKLLNNYNNCRSNPKYQEIIRFANNIINNTI